MPGLEIVPLGGCGEFGRNATACAADGDVLLVDFGVQMPDDLAPGVERYVPAPDGLLAALGPPRALFLTHGHDDHVAAVPFLLRVLGAPLPIYGRRLTLRLLGDCLDEARTPAALRDLREVRPGDTVPVGALSVRVLAVPHSIPDAAALHITSRGGQSVLHSGDLKLEAPADLLPLPRPGSDGGHGVDLLVADSTNATRPGRSGREEEARQALGRVLEQAPGRVIVALFASHIERLAHIAESCARSGRRLCLLGRGLRAAAAAAREVGAFRPPSTLLCDEAEAARLAARQVALACTGSQGEADAALGRLRVGPGDTVVLAARTIPGSERPLARLTDRILRAGATVLSGMPYAVSGHACQEELRELLAWVRPRALLPVHGRLPQLAAHAELAHGLGIPALLAQDGDRIQVGTRIEVRGRIATGRLAVEGRTVGEVGEETLAGRRELARAGVVLAAGRPGALQVRALGVRDAGAELERLCAEAARAGERALSSGAADGPPEQAVRQAVRRVFFRARGVRPVVVVVLGS